MRNYMQDTDHYGKLWVWTAVIVILMVPAAICLRYGAWPEMTAVLKGLLGVAPIYWTVGVIEVITYTPMLGVGGTYLAFVTGNLTSLKAPSALNAMENAGVKPGSEEGEVISTLAIATCSIVTTLVLALGVVLLALITPILNSPILAPAFDHILPALFGGLAVVYVSKNWKLSIAPLVFMVALFTAVPSLAGSVGVLVPVGVIIALAAARILYKKGWV
ncbi:MAG: hypothetical protein IJE22_08880 [Oscillibacter sp.]|nr:hypothetical protein [Oscillibacter sp.]MBQ2997327.1 hypothetical protein [Oscillibacter sp.]